MTFLSEGDRMSENGADGIIVVGASAAGLRAAARARRRLPKASITVIDEGAFISYSACGLPYYVSGDIDRADKLRETAYGVTRDPDYFRSAKGVLVVTRTRVERIDRETRKVFCISVDTGEKSNYSYDKLVLYERVALGVSRSGCVRRR